MPPLTPEEARVLGALLEKEATTPEYYPLTMNALIAACNQKSSRWPVTEYSESDVRLALEGLKARGAAAEILGNGRVSKFAQRYTEKLNLGRRESAILCVLLLRGPQTPGEIKGRTDRAYSFADMEEVDLVLEKMAAREEGALAQKLPAAPGQKEARWAHTLSGAIEISAAPIRESHSSLDRIGALEAEVAQLRAEVTDLRRRLDEVLN